MSSSPTVDALAQGYQLENIQPSPEVTGLGFQFEFEVTLESLTSPFLILFSQFPSIPLKLLYQLQQS